MNRKMGLLLILIAILLIFSVLLLDSDKPKVSKTSQRTDKYSSRVNEHLVMTQLQMETDREKLKYQLEHERDRAGELYFKGQDFTRPELDPYATLEVAEKTVEEGGRNSVYDPFPDPQQLVHKELFENERNRFLAQAEKEAYAQQFIENARRAGWKVTLDGQYRVIGVTRIRKAPDIQVLPGRDPSGAH